MFVSIDGSSLARRLPCWGLAYAVAVVPCLIIGARLQCVERGLPCNDGFRGIVE